MQGYSSILGYHRQKLGTANSLYMKEVLFQRVRMSVCPPAQNYWPLDRVVRHWSGVNTPLMSRIVGLLPTGELIICERSTLPACPYVCQSV